MKGTPRPHLHDIVFSGISRSKEDVFFLQIGAADGRRYDPIYHFVRRYDWTGVLVEPLPDIFEMLKANYAGQAGLVFENAAITEKDETREIHRVPLESVGEGDVPRWAFGASTLVPDKTRFARRNSPAPLHDALSAAAITEEVRCLSLTSVLDKHAVERIDVLQLDTEGYDARILRQLDLRRYRPSVINMEWQWLDEAERNEVSTRLRAEGYSLHGCEADLLATAGPLQELVVPGPTPVADAVPRFFPGIVGYAVEPGADAETGASSRQVLRIEFRRARNTRLSVTGQPALATFLAQTDGRRSYRQLAERIGCPLDVLLEWGRQLQSLYVFE
jgi:FkbM family methyltransferase